MKTVPFAELGSADLVVDSVYRGGRKGNAGDDPLPRLLQVSSGGGFRFRGQLDQGLKLLVLTSSRKDPNWPDTLDLETGVYTYYGDNKKPGLALHKTPRKGNQILNHLFGLSGRGNEGRKRVPPILVFENTGEWRDVMFLGLAVPGTTDLRVAEDLVAIWKNSKGQRFQNYRARFTILDTSLLSRAWVRDTIDGKPHSRNTPKVWAEWVETGKIHSLRCERPIEYRKKAEQVPQDSDGLAILRVIHSYFESDRFAFERCACALARLLLPEITKLEMTRPSRDGGRDGLGEYRVGAGDSSIKIDFALEAKCKDITNGVGVKEVSRLISRLRHRQFGILVTTSYVGLQAYKEIKEDKHPIIVLAGTDIVELLRVHKLKNSESVRNWLKLDFPLAQTST